MLFNALIQQTRGGTIKRTTGSIAANGTTNINFDGDPVALVIIDANDDYFKNYVVLNSIIDGAILFAGKRVLTPEMSIYGLAFSFTSNQILRIKNTVTNNYIYIFLTLE